MGAAAAARASNTQNPTRPPLIPSEKDNAATLRRPKSKLISSRYMSSSISTSSTSSSSTTSSNSSSRRCSSPLVTRSTPPETHSTVRSLSADRRRPEPRVFNNVGPGDVSAAARVLKTSVRTLSVSFQGESFALPVSKTKAAPATPSASAFASSRKLTPERRRSASPHVENSRPSQSSDQQLRRWPRIVSRDLGVLTRSLDFTADLKRGGSLKVESRKSFDGRLWPSLGSDNSCDLSSDSESVSSGSNSGVHESCRAPRTPRGSNGLPAKLWPETNARLRRLQDKGSLLSPNLGFLSKRNSLDSPPTLSPRTAPKGRALSSPLRGPPARHPSPLKFPAPTRAASPSRGMVSPSRTRGVVSVSHNVTGGVGYNQPSISMPSILSFGADCRTRKMGKSQVEELHLSKIYYNGHLQWRFANARAEEAMVEQMKTAEKNLYKAWLSTSRLRDLVTKQKIRLHILTRNVKLTSILKGQMTHLEEWANMDRDHSSSLSGAVDAMKASTLRLPVVDGAMTDIQKLKDASASAIDVMQAIASSTRFLLSKIENMNTLVTEIAGVATQERALLDHCGYLLSTMTAMQVTQCSLRTNLLQLKLKPRLTYL
ncbi:hypothetical protein QJS04_geneDACA006350 [Acorus gramineus]|uniref:Uncharacterized protein n=1 Tax=Acorus gramineus TaxID=55184 RepID=A0AAV9AY80_ACOGR|nr:hypothetical protein QJS04_geneDACA006350 [Acorus gramineus]